MAAAAVAVQRGAGGGPLVPKPHEALVTGVTSKGHFEPKTTHTWASSSKSLWDSAILVRG